MATKTKSDSMENEWNHPISAENYRKAAEEKKIISKHPDEPNTPPPLYPANFEIRMKSGVKMYGTISNVDHEEEVIYLLDKTQVGMFGKPGDGQKISFDDIAGIHSMTSPGVYGSKDELEQWIRWWRISKL